MPSGSGRIYSVPNKRVNRFALRLDSVFSGWLCSHATNQGPSPCRASVHPGLIQLGLFDDNQVEGRINLIDMGHGTATDYGAFVHSALTFPQARPQPGAEAHHSSPDGQKSNQQIGAFHGEMLHARRL